MAAPVADSQHRAGCETLAASFPEVSPPGEPGKCGAEGSSQACDPFFHKSLQNPGVEDEPGSERHAGRERLPGVILERVVVDQGTRMPPAPPVGSRQPARGGFSRGRPPTRPRRRRGREHGALDRPGSTDAENGHRRNATLENPAPRDYTDFSMRREFLHAKCCTSEFNPGISPLVSE